MSHISAADYHEYHESRDTLMGSYPEQYPRRHYHGPTQRPRCEACGQRFDADELNDSGVCGTCEKEIAAMEEGRV